MSTGSESDPAQPGATDRSGLLVTVLLAGAVVELSLATAVALAVGLPPAWAVAAGATATLGLSCAAALALGALLRSRRPPPTAERVIHLPGPVSLARRDALELVESARSRLLRAIEVAAPDAELLRWALDLQNARLRLAGVLLEEDGELPQALEDELLVAHRGTSDWLRSPRLS